MSVEASALTFGLAVTTFGFGLRHGIDWDHIAAISDITATQDERRIAMRLATLYALGHAAVVFVLGVGAIALGERLPASVDSAMERVVGATLVAMGVWVFLALARDGRDFRMRSRWMLLFGAASRGWGRMRRARSSTPELVEIEHEHDHPVVEEHAGAPAHVGSAAHDVERVSGEPTASHSHSHVHRHVAAVPADPFATYGPRTAIGVGMLHGIGAETPTQVALFVAAAGVAGAGTGLILLAIFLAGLFTSNTVIAMLSSQGFLSATRHFRVYVTVSVTIAAMSLAVGALFLFGEGSVLPELLG